MKGEPCYSRMIANTAELLNNLEQLHTTPMGVERIRKNMSIDTDDVVEWCRCQISLPQANIKRQGKNWYIVVNGGIITVNAYSYTIITAHKLKN